MGTVFSLLSKVFSQSTEGPPEIPGEILQLLELLSIVSDLKVRLQNATHEPTIAENEAIEDRQEIIVLIESTLEQIQMGTISMTDKNAQIEKSFRDWFELMNKLQLNELELNLESLLANKSSTMDRHYEVFEPLVELGSGSFGRAIMVKEKKSQSVCALKQIRIDKNNKDDLELAQREVKALIYCRHDGLVFIFESWFENPESLPEEGHFCPFRNKTEGSSAEESQSPKGATRKSDASSQNCKSIASTSQEFCRTKKEYVYLFIAMEICEGGSLKKWLEENKRLEDRPLQKMKQWLAQLCTTMEYVHAHDHIHGDLKPQNVFIKNGCLKIGDFGLSKFLPYIEQPSGDNEMRQELDYGSCSEMYDTRSYSMTDDVRGIGLIFCEMLVPAQSDDERINMRFDLCGGCNWTEIPGIDAPEEMNSTIEFIKGILPPTVGDAPNPTFCELLDSPYLIDVEAFYE